MTAQDTLTRQLDELERKLPSIPSQVIRLGRATVHRVNDVTCSIAERVSGAAENTRDVAADAASTASGQARSGISRTTKVAERTSKQTVGQARAQTVRTADSAEHELSGVLADATAAVEPIDLDGLTKAELYERAQQLDIDGRSDMNKSELRAAVATHTRTA